MSKNSKTLNTENRKPIYKQWWFILIIVFIALGSLSNTKKGMSNDNISENLVPDSAAENKASETIEPTSESVYEYDTLQKLFMSISFDTTEDDIIREYEKNKLEHDYDTYKGSKSIEYTIGYEYRSGRNPIQGDNIEVTFDMETGELKYAVYTKSFVSAILYNYGIYWNLRAQSPNSEKSGYYGDVVGTHHYERVNDAEAAIRYVLDRQKKD